MTDRDLLAKKLAFADTCIADLRRLGRPESLETDLRERRFVEHTLQLAIQACLDAASHIVSDERLGEPETNRQLFQILARNGWISSEAAETLGNMAAFRNLLVHGYAEVDLDIVREILAEHLDEVTDFAATIRHQALPPA